MSNRIPKADERYADNGRREATIGDKMVSYKLRELASGDRDRARASHAVTMRHMTIEPDTVLVLGGVAYKAVDIRDANRSGPPEMQGRFVEILCNPVTFKN